MRRTGVSDELRIGIRGCHHSRSTFRIMKIDDGNKKWSILAWPVLIIGHGFMLK